VGRSATIHPTAVVEPGAKLGDDVTVGPYCVVGADVCLGDGVTLLSHAVVAGRTEVGPGTKIFPFASIGHAPQDLKYRGEPSQLVIGRYNTIREYVTMNPGTAGGDMVTRVGDGCLFMAGAHVAHDCTIGNGVIMANNATMAGHVTVGDQAVLGGLCAVHQFVRIGTLAMIGGLAGVEFDVIPYGSVVGNRACLAGLNLVGLKRRGVPREELHALRRAYQELFAPDGTMAERIARVAEQYAESPWVAEVVAFMRAPSQRGICQARLEDAGTG
jgi:UDP-N-acetylglucosamine acyltransferase